jgi:hypothetical protein
MNTPRLVALAVITTICTTALAPAAFAQDATTATVTGGALTVTTPLAADFAGRSITGKAQITTAALDTFSVDDLRGTGAGWRVTLQASPFTSGTTPTRTLAAGSLTMPAPSVSSPDTLSGDPTIAPGPYSLDTVTATTVANAAVDTGMGSYAFSASTMTLALPANVYAGAYTSTVTVSVITGP